MYIRAISRAEKRREEQGLNFWVVATLTIYTVNSRPVLSLSLTLIQENPVLGCQ